MQISLQVVTFLWSKILQKWSQKFLQWRRHVFLSFTGGIGSACILRQSHGLFLKRFRCDRKEKLQKCAYKLDYACHSPCNIFGTDERNFTYILLQCFAKMFEDFGCSRKTTTEHFTRRPTCVSACTLSAIR
jgi:hypothetical protein